MQYALIRSKPGWDLSLMVAIDPARMQLLNADTPKDILTLLAVLYPSQLRDAIEKVQKQGISGALGVIYSGAFTMKAISPWIEVPHDFDIAFHDDDRLLTVGDEKFVIDPYGRDDIAQPCRTRKAFLENALDRKYAQAPFDCHMASGNIARQAASLSLGVCDVMIESRPDDITTEVLQTAARYAHFTDRMPELEDRSPRNASDMASVRAQYAHEIFFREAMVIGDRPVNPTRFIRGPQWEPLMRLADPDILETGRSFGRKCLEIGLEATLEAGRVFASQIHPKMERSLSAHEAIELRSLAEAMFAGPPASM